MSYLLALDQGTTSSRAMVFDCTGVPRGSAQEEFPQHFPAPGWVEHDPEDLWRTQLATAHRALSAAGVGASQVAAIGITNQRETTIAWDRATGAPLHPALVWQDRRTAPLTDRLKAEGREPWVRAKTGLLLDPYFSAPKLAWLLDHVPGLRARAEQGTACFGTVDSWLLFRLTGGRIHATDVSNASRTLLLDLHALAWDEGLLELFGVPRGALPDVRPSAGFFGTTDPALFGRAMPVTGIAGDQQAALFGQACLTPGMAKNTYGTGAFAVMNTGEHPVLGDGVLATVAWQLGDRPAQYALEGSIFVAGAAVQWLRDSLGLIGSAQEVEALAASVPDAGGVTFVPALTGLGSPHWDPHARGLIGGLTRGTTRAHLARAALEAMAFQTRDALVAMEAASGIALRELRVDGGAAVNDLLLQVQADLLGTSVVRPRVTETTALGAAWMAGVGAGLLAPEDLPGRWAEERRFTPALAPEGRAARCRAWARAVERARGWVDGEPV